MVDTAVSLNNRASPRAATRVDINLSMVSIISYRILLNTSWQHHTILSQRPYAFTAPTPYFFYCLLSIASTIRCPSQICFLFSFWRSILMCNFVVVTVCTRQCSCASSSFHHLLTSWPWSVHCMPVPISLIFGCVLTWLALVCNWFHSISVQS